MAFSVEEYLKSDEHQQRVKMRQYVSDPAGGLNGSDALMNWYRKGVGQISKVADDYNQRKGKFQNKADFSAYYNEQSAHIDSLAKDAEVFKSYLADQDVPQEVWEQVDGLTSGLRQFKTDLSNEKDYWFQFESEEDYNRKLQEVGGNANIRGGVIDYNADKMQQYGADKYRYFLEADTSKMTASADEIEAHIDRTNTMLFRIDSWSKYRNKGYMSAPFTLAEINEFLGEDDPEHMEVDYTPVQGHDDPNDPVNITARLTCHKEQYENVLGGMKAEQKIAVIIQESEAAMNALDFEEKAKQGAAADGDWDFKYINDIDNRRLAVEAASLVGASIPRESKYDYMTDNEIKIYNYYHQKALDDPEHYKDADKQYLKDIEELLHMRGGEEQGKNAEKLGIIGKIAHGIYAGFDKFAMSISQIFSEEDLPASMAEYASDYISEHSTEVERFIYDAVSNACSALPSAGLGALSPGLGAVSAVASASAGSYRQARRMGYSRDYALNYGIDNGLKVFGKIVAGQLLFGANSLGMADSQSGAGLPAIGGFAEAYPGTMELALNQGADGLIPTNAGMPINLYNPGFAFNTEDYLQGGLENLNPNLLQAAYEKIDMDDAFAAMEMEGTTFADWEDENGELPVDGE
ncbi:MAG: hypothetical protein ACYCX2_12125, partial [Christensenellales bacterium]